MKSVCRGLLLVFSFLISFKSYSATINWLGGTSTNWALGANWSGGVAPTSADDVQIGVISTAFTRNPDISTVQACKSLTLGPFNTITLSITATGSLAVTGAFNHLPSAIINVTSTITGAGVLTCASLQVGNGTNATIGNNNTLTLISTLANLHVTGGLTVNSTNYAILFIGTGYINATFSLRGGTTTVDGQLYTLNTQQGILPLTDAVPKLSVDVPSGSALTPILKLTNVIPINPSSVKASMDFFNNTGGTGSTTIEYGGIAGQTVYTNITNTILDTTTAVYQNIIFSATGQKNIQTGNLTISGNWTSSTGKVDAVSNNPTVIFRGTTQSLIDAGSDGGNGVTFKNVIFTGGGTKTVTSGKFNVASSGVLTMASSSTLNANGNLTLFSDASSTAAVAVIPTGSSITNDVNVQRYLVGGNTKVSGVYTARGYRMLSSPVNYNGTAFLPLSYIGNSALTGGPGTGFTATINNPTIYLYREDVAPSNTTFNSGKHKGILNIKAGNIVTVSGVGDLQVPVGNGYIFYFVGNTSNIAAKTVPPFTVGPESTAITAVGRLNQGDVTVNLWYTPAGATGTTTNKLSYNASLVNPGFNMVGNPYASTLDLDDVITDNTASITNYVYELYNVNPSQKYIAYAKGGSSDPGATRYVVSGQGFIVRAKGINGSLVFHESQKEPLQTVVAPNLLMGMPIAENTITGFYMKMERDSIVDDYCGIYFNSDASANYDDTDAQDLDGASAQVYMSSFTADGVRAAINHMPDYRKGTEVKLFVNSTSNGLYKLKIEAIRNIDPLYDIWLKDNFTKDSLNLRLYPAYSFNIAKSDTSTFGANRFKLVIRRKALPAYQLVSFTATKVTEGIKITWKVNNEGNYTRFELEKLNSQYNPVYNVQSNGNGTYSFIDRNPLAGINTYRLKQDDIDNAISFSNPISVQLIDPTSDKLLTVYPNPAVDNIKVYLNSTEPNGSYIAKIYDYSGIVVLQSIMQNGNWSQYVGKLKPGTYIFELSKSSGEFIGRTKFIKKL